MNAIPGSNWQSQLPGSSDEVLRTIEIVLSAYGSVLSAEGGLAYVSMPITTGKLMYDVLTDAGVRSVEELRAKDPDALMKLIIRPNISRGIEIARGVTQIENRPVVAPSIFEAREQRWTQAEYMMMWSQMIELYVGRMYMSPDWQYTNGGSEEYLESVLMSLGFRVRWQINISDCDGQPIPLHQGMTSIALALEDLHRRKFKAPALVNVFRSLATAHFAWLIPDIMHDLSDDWNRDFANNVDHAEVRYVQQSFLPLLRHEYGVEQVCFREICPVRGIVRASDVLPESVILKEVEKR